MLIARLPTQVACDTISTVTTVAVINYEKFLKAPTVFNTLLAKFIATFKHEEIVFFYLANVSSFYSLSYDGLLPICILILVKSNIN